MSLPAETKFPCAIRKSGQSVAFDFSSPKTVAVTVDSCEDWPSTACLDREQIESLRDQLSDWLEVTK